VIRIEHLPLPPGLRAYAVCENGDVVVLVSSEISAHMQRISVRNASGSSPPPCIRILGIVVCLDVALAA